MKPFLRNSILFLSFVCMTNPALAEDLSATSKISSVTVYPGSAHITRTTSLDLTSGEHSVVFEKIIPPLDENSISVSGEGAAGVRIYGARIKQDYTQGNPDERVTTLEKKIEEIDDKVTSANDELQVLAQQKEFLNSVKLYSATQIPKELVTSMPPVQNLKDLKDYLGEELADVNKKSEEVRLRIRSLSKDKQKLVLELNNLRGANPAMKRILVVDLACDKPGKFNLQVSYLVDGAFWRPVYDARTNIANSEVEFTSYGVLKQTTGEDWNNVELILSTAQPALGGNMPYVSPWLLNFYQPQVRRAGLAEKLEIGQTVQYEPYYNSAAFSSKLEAESDANKPASIEYSQINTQGVSVVYKIARPISLKSDGSESKFPIATQTLKANFEYSSYPRVQELAFLGSKATNSKDVQLLAGEVNLFLDGDYVGKSNIQNVGPGEEFSLYLGVNENVKVKRQQVSRKVDDVMMMGISSPNRTTTFKYKLTVENYQSRPVAVKLFESMPVSENEKIKVKMTEVSLAPTKKDWEDRKGVWLWDLNVKPKEKIEIFYTFSVEHPRDLQVDGI